MPEPSFIERLKRAGIVRALVVYLAASWVVLEVTATLQDILGLPEWTAAVAFVLLLSGLVVILATAWVQSQPGLQAREDAGEVPDSWDLELKDMGKDLREGRLPHLTWGRAIVGGAVVFALLFGLAFGYVLFSPDAPRPGPAPLAAEATAAPGVAVVPFSVSGPELELWREGMVDLLATNLDGLGGLRGVDSRTVLARWYEAVPENARPDLDTMLGVGRAAEASWVLIGSIVGADQVRLSVDAYELETGNKLGTARAEGTADEMMALVDELSVGVATLLLDRNLGDGGFLNLSSVTTASLPALEAFLQGESHYRRAEYEPAIRWYSEAVAEDSTFALAWMGLADAYGWTATESNLAAESAAQAARYQDRLPAREQLLVRSQLAFSLGSLAMLPEMEAAVRRYPDDPEIVYETGEYYTHFAGQVVPAIDSTVATFERAIALDPTFGPFYTHAVDLTMFLGDSARAAGLLEAQGKVVSPTDFYHSGSRLAFELVFGNDSVRAAAWDRFEADPGQYGWSVASLGGTEEYSLQARVSERLLGRAEWSPEGYVSGLAGQGRLRRASEYLSDQDKLSIGLISLPVHVAGLPVYLDSWRPDLPASTDPPAVLMSLAIAAINGEPSAPPLDSVLVTVERRGEVAAAANDTVEAGRWSGLAEALSAYRMWKAGETAGVATRLEGALARIPAWDPVFREWIGPGLAIRWWLGEIHAERDQLDQSAEHFQRLFYFTPWAPLAQYRLGDLYERLDRPEEARRAYATFLDAWEDADPELQPIVENARERLAALTGEG